MFRLAYPFARVIEQVFRFLRMRARKSLALRFFYSLDVRAKFAQFFIEPFVAAIDVIDTAHFSNSVGLQSRKHQRGGRTQIARHHRRAKKTIDPLDHRSSALQLHLPPPTFSS